MTDEFTEDCRCPITDRVCANEWRCTFCDVLWEIRQFGNAVDNIKNGQGVEMFYKGKWIRGKVIWREGCNYIHSLLTMRTSTGDMLQCEIRDKRLYRFVEVDE